MHFFLRLTVSEKISFPHRVEKNRSMRGNVSWHKLFHRIFRKLLVLSKKCIRNKICTLIRATTFVQNIFKSVEYFF